MVLSRSRETHNKVRMVEISADNGANTCSTYKNLSNRISCLSGALYANELRGPVKACSSKSNMFGGREFSLSRRV